MIIDSLLEFGRDFSATVAANTNKPFTNTLDLSAARNIGAVSRPFYWVTQVDADIKAGASSQVRLQLKTASAAAGVATGTIRAHAPLYTNSDLTRGFRIAVPLPSDTRAWDRYLACVLSASVALTGGNFTSYLTCQVPDWVAYPDAIN